MIINIRTADPHNTVAHTSLLNWLYNTDYIKDHAQLEVKISGTDAMGIDLNVIQLVLETGFNLANLVLAIAEWRTRSGETAAPLVVQTDGKTTELSLEDLENRNVIRRALVGAPDPRRSSCVLIGVSDYAYATLPELPAVRQNLAQLAKVLGDSTIWGIPPEQLHTVSNPQSAADIRAAIAGAADEAPDTLLVYYAGHGLYDKDDGLLLALPEATSRDKTMTVPWHELAELIQHANCDRRVVWLDCCYARLALSGKQALPDLHGIASVEGIYVLAAAQEHEAANASGGAECTAFTGELVSVLRKGIAPGPPDQEFLTLEAIHKQAHSALTKKRLPQPVRLGPGRIGQLPHFRNNAPRRPRDQEPRPRPARTRRLPRWPFRYVASAVIAVLLAALVVLLVTQPWQSSRYVGGVDLAGYCTSQNLSLATPNGEPYYCEKTVTLSEACDWQYGQSDMTAMLVPGNQNGAECSPQKTGLSDLPEFCQIMIEAASDAAFSMATNVTEEHDSDPNKWICLEPINMNDACDFSQRLTGLTNLVARDNSNGVWDCYT